jgi:tripartite-type tricarboxylate transporter receptor subunit TctC
MLTLRIAFLLAVCAACAVPAQAQKPLLPGNYPVKPIRLLVGFPPGGGNDGMARLLAQKLGERWGTQVVVENRPGGNGIVLMQLLASAPPDGYTIALGGAQLATATLKDRVLSQAQIDVRQAYVPVVQLSFQPYVWLVTPSLPAHSVADLVAYARSRPGSLNYSTSGSITVAYLSMEQIKRMLGIDIVAVPYKGTNQQMIDLIAGQVQMSILNMFSAVTNLRSGKLRALAVMSPRRSPAFPDLPTVSEAGVTGFSLVSWYGLFGPARMPRSIVLALNEAASQIVNVPETRARLASDTSETVPPHPPEEFRSFFSHEIDRWEQFVRASGIRLE